MTSIAGQAARGGLARGGDALILLGRAVLAGCLLAALGVAALAWRLAEGPVELPWLARRIEAAAGASGQAVTIEHLLVSWSGFSHPDAPPLRLRLLGIQAAGSFGQASLARVDVALPVLPLLGGHVEPDTADLSGLRLRIAASPAVADRPPPDFAAVLRSLASPSAAPEQAWSRLRHLHLHDAAVDADGVPGKIAGLDVDLDRTGGGLTGTATARLQAASQQATLTLAAQIAPDGTGTKLRAGLTAISPASLAGTAPAAAALAALDAPVTLSGSAVLGPALELIQAEADIVIGSGTIHAGQGTAPLLGADLHATATPGGVTLRLARLDTAPAPDAARTRFSGQAAATRAEAGGWQATASLDVDQVAFADLAALWPEGTGGPGTRPWMTKNITAGRMTAGHVEMDLSVPADLSDVALRRIAGGIEGHDVTVHWLRPVPPLEHAEARLTVSDPDIIDIAVDSATQAGGAHGGMRYHDATIHLTGIAGTEQYAEIRTGLAGPLADLLTVLNHPRIQLLAKRPLPMRDPRGDVTAQVRVARLPLRDDVKLDDLVIETAAHTSHTHLGGIAAGYDLDDGTLDLAANNDGLTVSGTAALAGFASRLKIGMDFRNGPPTQVQETVAAHSTIRVAHLAALGVNVGAELGGSAELDTTLAARRGGQTEITLAADLAQLTLAEPRAGVEKRAGEAGEAHVRVVLNGARFMALDDLRIEAPGISVLGRAEVEGGTPRGLRLDRLILGRGTDLHGEIRMQGPDRKVSVHLSGPSFDLSPALGGTDRPAFGRSGGAMSGAPDRGMGGRPWEADVAADRVILGPGRSLDAVRVVADSDGAILRSAAVSARVAGSSPEAGLVQAAITPDSGGRRLTIDAADTGALLRVAAVTDALIGGRLHVVARWADGAHSPQDPPLGGVVDMRVFRVRDAPEIGRVLQALTVYGLVELARGPGLGFSRLTAPFALEQGVLDLRQARAFSASLGFTARGRIDLRRRVADLSGTVVPAYFFNSLLGRVPLVGRLFSAETGGGLFAVAVKVTGPLDDLRASVNPLSAIAPGALRSLFEAAPQASP